MSMDKDLATERLIDQFESAGIAKIDAIAGMTALAATTFFEAERIRGREAQGLSD